MQLALSDFVQSSFNINIYWCDRGDDYRQHTKCITEEEKYSGKNYKPKPGANKGEVKQELWMSVRGNRATI